ncbi:hypothetical protein ACI7RC_09485 [Brevibacillus sp. B_LB10_24]|uniref:hypothetical protein n=1 Tax=Brevibacillus sp. B_LB10_24 TaxID=3380645 RepID=UPI0038BC6CAA
MPKRSRFDETIAASSSKDGIYRIKTLFSEGGAYGVTVHVLDKGVTITSPETELTIADSEFSTQAP